MSVLEKQKKDAEKAARLAAMKYYQAFLKLESMDGELVGVQTMRPLTFNEADTRRFDPAHIERDFSLMRCILCVSYCSNHNLLQ